MRCGKAKKWLMAYHDGELGAERRTRLEGHLDGCGRCRALLERLNRADGAARIPEPGEGYWDDLTARVMDRVLREEEDRRQARAKPRPKWVFAVARFAPALSIALVVVVAAGVLTRMKSPAPPSLTYPKEAPAADQAGVSEKSRSADSDRETHDLKSESVAADRLDDRGDVVRERVDRAASNEVAAQPAPMREGRGASGRMEASAPVGPPSGGADSLQESVPWGAVRAAGELDVNSAAVMKAPGPAPGSDKGTTAPPSPRVMGYVAGPNDEALFTEERRPAAGAAGKAADARGPVSQLDAAQKLADDGRYADSERALKSLLSQRPPEPVQERASILLVKVLQFQNRLPEAQSFLDEVRRQYPESGLVQGFELRMEAEGPGR